MRKSRFPGSASVFIFYVFIFWWKAAVEEVSM